MLNKFKLSFFLLLCTVVFCSNLAAISLTIIGDEIKPLIRLYDGFIVNYSDSVFLNGELLLRSGDYNIDYTYENSHK